ncbi:MAG: MFS transporter [Alphaproteobacteria bacterium]
MAGAGVSFQAGSAAVDSATIMSALVFQLTGSPIAVGAVPAILRFGWLSPQLFVGYLAQRGTSSLQYYIFGAFGRAACIAVLAVALFLGKEWATENLAITVMGLWTAYAFTSGIVAVPYNDIVARSIASKYRSRLLATRFFGGGVLALGVATIADQLIGRLAFPDSYAAIFAMAALLMFVSSAVFISVGEPGNKEKQDINPSFLEYLENGLKVFRTDEKFRAFVLAQWCGGAVLMAMPFYIVHASNTGLDLENIAMLLGAQTTGALVSNALWGWWGDYRGKGNLLQAIAFGRILPPGIAIGFTFIPFGDGALTLIVYMALFFILGALANGLTIAVIGFLMEISPDDQRPAYSGYFSAITAPAFLLPFPAGIIASVFGLEVVFVISMIAASAQFLIVSKLCR